MTTSDNTDHTVRESNPICELSASVGRGAVLYDTRKENQRPCCDVDSRCLAHVIGVCEETTTETVYFRVADGTHTAYE